MEATAAAEGDDQDLLKEQELAKNGGLNAMSNYNQKVIERKEAELRNLVMANYSRIREVEKELSQLQLQVKLTAGPKRQALELLRKKIEVQNETVVNVRQRYAAAKQTLANVEAELKREEEEKDRLCNELNLIIQQSTSLQLSKLEELRQHLEMLNTGMMPGTYATATAAATAATAAVSGVVILAPSQPTQQVSTVAGQSTVSVATPGSGQASNAPDTAAAQASGVGAAVPVVSQANGTQADTATMSGSRPPQLRAAQPDPAAAAAAAAARSRHVTVGSGKPARQLHAAQPSQRGTPVGAATSHGQFTGFDT